MAPCTRRSNGAPASSMLGTSDGASDVAIGSNAAATSDPPRKRGRPPKAVISGYNSVSSARNSADSISESGDYSTPATSNAVTPAPSVSAKPAAANGTRSRLVVELPDVMAVEGNIQMPAGITSASSRGRRTRRPISYEVADSEDDDSDDLSRDPKLARRLQREEDEAFTTSVAQPSSFKDSLKKLTRSRMPMVADSEDDEFREDVIAGLQSTRARGRSKGKGKMNAVSAGAKRKAISNNDSESDAGIDLDASNYEENEPLSRSAPARKKQKTGPVSSDEGDSDILSDTDDESVDSGDGAATAQPRNPMRRIGRRSARGDGSGATRRARNERRRLEHYHPELRTMWDDLENMPVLKAGKAAQPASIVIELKPFQLEGLAWMKAMERTEFEGGLLGDEMGLGKTLQAVSLIMSDFPAKNPTLVLVPPVALMQWTKEIGDYTEGKLKTLVFHGTTTKAKKINDVKELKKYHVILMSYNTLESLYRKQEKGTKQKGAMVKEKSVIHKIKFHRVILDEAHCIKTRSTGTAKACFALDAEYRWCLTGTPLQNRIGEFFSLVRFLNITPFSSYLCKQCPCSINEWAMDEDGNCNHCQHHSMRHVSVFNQELLNPIQKYGNLGEGREAFQKLRLLMDRIMLRRLKKDHTYAMKLPVKEIHIDRQFFGEAETDFANSIMTNTRREFDTYAAQGVILNNYANIFGLLMQMRQVADHPDMITKKSAEGGQNILVCCICDEPAEEAIRSKCQHDFCRSCAKDYINSQAEPDCPRCHIPLSIDLEQPEQEQDEALFKKSSIVNRINMEKWTSSTKIEMLVHELHKLRSDNAMHKSIIFSQFTSMLQLVEWRLHRAGISTVMLDGSMKPAQRQSSIDHFQNNVDVECFLVSMKAGGVALNLTEASRVFIVDPWWNPAAEWQSADRCHRIKQTRPCVITRLCIEDSVESRMVALQEKKTNMIHSTVNFDDAAMDSLTPEDLGFLFRGT